MACVPDARPTCELPAAVLAVLGSVLRVAAAAIELADGVTGGVREATVAAAATVAGRAADDRVVAAVADGAVRGARDVGEPKIAASRPRSKGAGSCSTVRSIAGFLSGLELASGAEFFAGDRGAVRDAMVAAAGDDVVTGVSRTAGRLDATSEGGVVGVTVVGGTVAGVRKLSLARSMPSMAAVEPSKSNFDRSVSCALDGRPTFVDATSAIEGAPPITLLGIVGPVGTAAALGKRRATAVGSGFSNEAEFGAGDADEANVEDDAGLATVGLDSAGANGSAGSARTPAKASSKASELEASWWIAAGSNSGANCEAADGALGDATDAIADATTATGGDTLATSDVGTADG